MARGNEGGTGRCPPGVNRRNQSRNGGDSRDTWEHQSGPSSKERFGSRVQSQPLQSAMRLFSYIRVSSKGQISGEGPDRQRDTIEAWARIPPAHALVGEFFEAVSGTVEGMGRPEFSAMVEAIVCRRINGETIDGIVVERLDRLARDLMVQEVLLKQCRENKIKVFSADRGDTVDQASDEGDPTRTLIRQVMGALAQWDKSQTVLKLRKAREAIAAKTGKPCGGGTPYGATPQEQVVLKMLKVFVTPDHTLKQVARMLNFEGFKTRGGFSWTEHSALKVMKVAGVWVRKNPVNYRLRNLGSARMMGEVTIGQLQTASYRQYE